MQLVKLRSPAFFRSRSLYASALLAVLLVLPPLQHAAQAQSTSQQQPSDGPPSGSPPDGAGPGGDPGSTSGSGDASTSSGAGESSGSATQGRRPGPPSPAMELDRMTKAMNAASLPLSDAQKVAILGVLEDKQTAMAALRTSTSDRSTVMQQTQALNQSSRTAILAVLTEAQQAIYNAMRQGPPPRPGSSNNSSGAGTSRLERFTEPVGEATLDANTGGGQIAPPAQ